MNICNEMLMIGPVPDESLSHLPFCCN